MTSHRRNGDPNGVYNERAEDNDRMTWFNKWWDRWGKTILWPLFVSGFFYVKENYLEPIKTIPALHVADSVSVAERGEITSRLVGHDLIFQILVKMQCEIVDGNSDRDLRTLCDALPDPTAEEISRVMRARPRGEITPRRDR